jgi:hypothetical protein
MNNKIKDIAVYTAIFGEYDDLKKPLHASVKEEADFYCFTDNLKLTSDFYTIIYCKPGFREHVRNSRQVKILGHPLLNEYAYTIWIDASLQLVTDSLEELLEPLLDTSLPLATFRHSKRACVYQEAIACIHQKKDFFTDISLQLLKYHYKGMPKDFGLFETGIVVRNHKSPFLQPLLNEWYQEIKTGTKRDQLSLPYVIWRKGVTIAFLKGSVFNCSYVEYILHKKHGYSYHKSLLYSLRSRFDKSFHIGRAISIQLMNYLYRNSSKASPDGKS